MEGENVPPDLPIVSELEMVCEECGLSIWSTETDVDKPAYTCGCDVTVYPTATNPDVPNSWEAVKI